MNPNTHIESFLHSMKAKLYRQPMFPRSLTPRCRAWHRALCHGVRLVLLLAGVAHTPSFANAAAPAHPVVGLQRAGGGFNQLKIDSWATEQGLPINTVHAMHSRPTTTRWVTPRATSASSP
jgi:hypothetical protein